MSHKIKTAATAKPITLDQAKDQLNIEREFTDQDDLITSLIATATALAEAESNRCLITTTWELYLDTFAQEKIHLPEAPLQSITKIEHRDKTTGEWTELAATVYSADTVIEPGQIFLKKGQSWPEVYDEQASIRVTFVAGYGDDGTKVPDTILGAIRMVVAHFYTNRGDEGHRKIPAAVVNILKLERVKRF